MLVKDKRSGFSHVCGFHNRCAKRMWYDGSMSLRKSRVSVACGRCGASFLAKPSHIAMGFGKYCSRECSALNQRTGRDVACHACNKVVYRIPKYLERSKSGKFFCTKSCQTIWRNKEFSGARHANWRHGMASYRNILLRAGKQVVCDVCKTTDGRVIIAHHKDKNRLNNSVTNLVWLCRNCHFLVHHYDMGRDRGLLVPRS